MSKLFGQLLAKVRLLFITPSGHTANSFIKAQSLFALSLGHLFERECLFISTDSIE